MRRLGPGGRCAGAGEFARVRADAARGEETGTPYLLRVAAREDSGDAERAGEGGEGVRGRIHGRRDEGEEFRDGEGAAKARDGQSEEDSRTLCVWKQQV